MVNAQTEVRCRNDLSELERVSQVTTAFGEQHQLPEKLIFEINLALEEVLVNVISYGYDDQNEDENEHEIVLHLSVQDEQVWVAVEDDGRPFNPLDMAVPDLEQPLEERQIGGLGIHLVRKVMDSLEYTRRQGKNRLVMKKHIERT